MTDQEADTTIAKELGWTSVYYSTSRGAVIGYAPGESYLGYLTVSNYGYDLNSLHEAELKLPYDAIYHAIILRNIVKKQERDDQSFDALEVELMLHATAAQRREALLRAMGKWKD